jgi:hypothetical protein
MDLDTARNLEHGTPVYHRTLGACIWHTRSPIDVASRAWVTRPGEAESVLVQIADVETAPLTQMQSWDWKDQIDLEMLASDLAHVSGGTIFLYPTDTGSDDIGYVISRVPLTAEMIAKAQEFTPKPTDGGA